jgi:hypothetical protein
MLNDEIRKNDDMLDAIMESLRRKGTISKLKSQIRAEVYNTLEDKTVVVRKRYGFHDSIYKSLLINFL